MNKISLEEHKYFGFVLKQLKKRLLDCCKKYNSKELLRQSKEQKALKELSILKNYLDDLVCRDYPDDWQGIYYGDIE